MAIQADSPIIADDFINESEADSTPANNAGKVAKLESNGRISPKFGGGGDVVQFTAGATINGATLPVPVYLDTSDDEVYPCVSNESGAAGARKAKWIGVAITDGTDGNPISVQLSGVVEGFSGLTPNVNYYLDENDGEIDDEGMDYNGRGTVKIGRSISATQLFLERGERCYRDNHLAHYDETDVDTYVCGFRPERIQLVSAPHYGFSGNSNVVAYADWDYTQFNPGTDFGGSGRTWTYEFDGSPQDSTSGSTGIKNASGTTVLSVDIDQVDDVSFRLTTTPLNGGPDTDHMMLIRAFGSF